MLPSVVLAPRENMNKEELLELLKKQAESDDTEAAHSNADGALLSFINDAEITAAYAAVPKWYA
ncbi:hypothetical protein [Nitrobacter hamburgensis]|uniref:hypothetical protein n=1 Tax=Nitrobacter hamburgensis TaxID=912 RepID=UPI00059BB2E3|nr:hypothetical protein [Nitrobacter hamburgensis]